MNSFVMKLLGDVIPSDTDEITGENIQYFNAGESTRYHGERKRPYRRQYAMTAMTVLLSVVSQTPCPIRPCSAYVPSHGVSSRHSTFQNIPSSRLSSSKLKFKATGKLSDEFNFYSVPPKSNNCLTVKEEDPNANENEEEKKDAADILRNFFYTLKKPPPFIIDDLAVVLGDVILIVNLSLSTSTWVVHRPSLSIGDSLGLDVPLLHVGSALSEGCTVAILWVAAGLLNGRVFRYVDDEPLGSAWEAANVFLTTSSLRILVALLTGE